MHLDQSCTLPEPSKHLWSSVSEKVGAGGNVEERRVGKWDRWERGTIVIALLTFVPGIGLRGMQQAVSCMEVLSYPFFQYEYIPISKVYNPPTTDSEIQGEERAHILMDPQWAYGPNGMPPVVPKNCKVFIDLEVLAFEVRVLFFCFWVWFAV